MISTKNKKDYKEVGAFCNIMQEIVLRSLEKPRQKVLSEDIEWVCESFGLCRGRDVESTSTKIVATMLEKLADNLRVSSELIAHELDMTASRVNHHLRNLMGTGFLYRDRRLILLRGGSLKGAVEELRKDSNRIFDQISDIAEEVDQKLGLENR